MEMTIKQRIGFVMLGAMALMSLIFVAKAMIDLWPWDFYHIACDYYPLGIMVWLVCGIWLLFFEDSY